MSKKKIKRPQQYKKPKDRTFREWWGDQSVKVQKTITCTLYVLLAVTLISIVYYYGIYDDGSLKISDNEIVGRQDNWLIADLGKGKRSDYYHIADVAAPEGYVSVESAVGMVSGSYATSFTFEPEAESLISMVYVSGAQNKPDELSRNAYANLSDYLADRATMGEIKTVETGHGTAYYFSYAYSYTNDETGEIIQDQSLNLYIPALYRNASVMVSVSAFPAIGQEYATEESMLAVALLAGENVTMLERQ